MKKYQFKKPEVTNVLKATWDTIKVRWQFWVVVVTAILVGLFFPAAIFVIPLYLVMVINKIKSSFWKQFAEVNGWRYKESVDSQNEQGIMFRQGSGGGGTEHNIEGNIDGRSFRVFGYQFTVGRGDSAKTYHYTVFAFKFDGLFPHIYLNNKYNSYGVSVGERIPLPGEFEKKFTLSAPRKYETEALEIFTPDVLAALLDNDFPHDVEFVDQEVLIFTSGQIDSFEQLEKEFNRALEIEDMLDEKLDKFKFEKIGDMSHTLS